jgi:hypothetical protein
MEQLTFVMYNINSRYFLYDLLKQTEGLALRTTYDPFDVGTKAKLDNDAENLIYVEPVKDSNRGFAEIRTADFVYKIMLPCLIIQVGSYTVHEQNLQKTLTRALISYNNYKKPQNI